LEGASVSQTYTDAKAAFATYTADKKLFDDYPAAKLAFDNYDADKLAFDNYDANKVAFDDYVAKKLAYDNYPAAKNAYDVYQVASSNFTVASNNYVIAQAQYVQDLASYTLLHQAWLPPDPEPLAPLEPLAPIPLGVAPINPVVVADPGATGPDDPGATRPANPGDVKPTDPGPALPPSTLVDNPNPSASAGTLSIQLGSWAGATFKGSSTALNVGIAVGDTFAQIADKVNAAFSGAATGIVATVVPGGGFDQLKFSYRGAIGEATGFRITNTGGELSQIAVDAKVATEDLGSSQLAQDAKVKVNGVEMAFASNNLVDITPGVTLKLNQIGSADISVEPDKDAVQTKVQAFADAFSALSKTLSDATKYVPGGQSGVLQGDTTTVGLQRLMREMFKTTYAGSTPGFEYLSNVGLELQTDGSLKVNSTSLTTAMGNMTSLQTLFTYGTAGPIYNKQTDGFGVRFRELAKELLNASGGSTSVSSSNGYVINKAAALQASITRNAYEQDKVNTRAAAVEKRLRSQYSALDAKMATMSSLSSYVTAQLAQWNKSSG
jgi:flagellar hook-associated protein 2